MQKPNYHQYLHALISAPTAQYPERYFHLLNILGEGGEGGVVYKAEQKNGDPQIVNVAVKIQQNMKHEERLFTENLISYQNEYENPSQLHKYYPSCIIRIYEIFIWNGLTVIIMDAGGQDLYSYLGNNSQKLNLIQKGDICKQIAKSIQMIHHFQYAHRDIKPENFIQFGKEFKLIDFGLTKSIDQTTTKNIGTILYTAPEVLRSDSKYTEKEDIWSLGCVFYEIITGQVLFDFKTTHETQEAILSSHLLKRYNVGGKTQQMSYLQYKLTQLQISDTWKTTIQFMLQFDPSKRISAAEVVNKLCAQPIVKVEDIKPLNMRPAVPPGVKISQQVNKEPTTYVSEIKYSDVNVFKTSSPTLKINDDSMFKTSGPQQQQQQQVQENNPFQTGKAVSVQSVKPIENQNKPPQQDIPQNSLTAVPQQVKQYILQNPETVEPQQQNFGQNEMSQGVNTTPQRTQSAEPQQQAVQHEDKIIQLQNQVQSTEENDIFKFQPLQDQVVKLQQEQKFLQIIENQDCQTQFTNTQSNTILKSEIDQCQCETEPEKNQFFVNFENQLLQDQQKFNEIKNFQDKAQIKLVQEKEHLIFHQPQCDTVVTSQQMTKEKILNNYQESNTHQQIKIISPKQQNQEIQNIYQNNLMDKLCHPLQCKDHDMECLFIDQNLQKEDLNRYFCAKCVIKRVGLNNLTEIKDACNKLNEVKKEFQIRKLEQINCNLKTLEEISSTIISLKEFYNKSIDKIQENIQIQITGLQESLKSIDINLQQIDIVQYFEQTNKFAKQETNINELQDLIQIQFQNLQQNEILTQCLTLIQQFDDKQILLVPEIIQNTQKQDHQINESLLITCTQHKKQIILFDLNEQNAKENRIACTQCIENRIGPFVSLIKIQKLWNEYQCYKEELLANQSGKIKQKVQDSLQQFQFFIDSITKNINETINLLNQKENGIIQLYNEEINQMKKDLYNYSKDEVLNISEILSNPQNMKQLQLQCDQEFEQQNQQLDEILKQSLLYINLQEQLFFKAIGLLNQEEIKLKNDQIGNNQRKMLKTN